MCPNVGSSKQFKHLKNVDLPEPDGPIITTFSPSLIVSVILSNTRRSPKLFVRFFMSINPIIIYLL